MLTMQYLRQTPIGLRLAAAFGALILLLLASTTVGLLSLQTSQARIDAMYRERVVPLKQLKLIADAYAVNVIDAVNKAHSGRLSAADAKKELTSAQALITRAWQDYKGSADHEDEKRLAAEAERLFGPANADIERVHAALAALTGPATGQLGAFNGPLYDSIDPISGKISELIDLQLRVAREAGLAAAAAHRQTLVTMLGICLATVLLAVLGAWLITRSITRPLAGALDSVRGLAGGNLDIHFETSARDELGQVLVALEHMTRQLASTVSAVRHASESVACASVQIAKGNLDLSGRTEEQASALQQTSATMEQMGEAVRNNADSAEAARRLAQDAAGVATKGGEVVGRVVATMQGISDSSRRIGDIVGVIDGIAFQTNILALNAAVEAARAGEQGRGFAVVAAEVRALAHRSAQSAREIKGLIGHNVAQVEQGTGLVDDAGKTMEEIVAAIRRVSSMMSEISTATTEQSGGILQIGDAVQQMDQATQQNAALVEESAAAAESLKQQARQLVDAVSVFKLAA